MADKPFLTWINPDEPEQPPADYALPPRFLDPRPNLYDELSFADELRGMADDVRSNPETHAMAFAAGALFTVAGAYALSFWI